MAMWYEVYICDSDITVFDSLAEAREYIKRRGYTQYEGSYDCEHPTEYCEYYVREGEDIDEDYADGYAPCITPVGEDDDEDDEDENVDECDDEEDEDDGVRYVIARKITDGVFDIISRHRTLDGAERAHRRRNPWVYNANWARQHGMSGCGTFEQIYAEEDGQIDEHWWWDK